VFNQRITLDEFTFFRLFSRTTTTTTASLLTRSQLHQNLLPSLPPPVRPPSLAAVFVMILNVFSASKGKSLFDDDDDD
jgi:hypothetical protein